MRLDILDTTLRDGAQSEGISFSVSDKLKITKLLDKLNIPFIEGGNPFSNKTDMEYFKQVKTLQLQNSKVVSFCSTRKKQTNTYDDTVLNATLCAGTEYVSLVGKSSVHHVKDVIKTTLEENLAMISDSIAFLIAHGKTVFFDAEHFFDGFKEDSSYALSCLQSAIDAGCLSITLCDTNGGSLPEEIYKITNIVKSTYPQIQIGIHCHNDIGLAVCGALSAISAGATLVQGTLLGFGERCGNTNLSTIIPILETKLNKNVIGSMYLKKLTSICFSVAETCNINIENNLPYIGNSAFAHKGGMHSDGIHKTTTSFEHIHPEVVGNMRRILLSEVAGRSAVLEKIKMLYPDFVDNNNTTLNILNIIKDLEFNGYSFEGADASFELLLKRELGTYKSVFKLIELENINKQPAKTDSKAIANIKISVKDKTTGCSAFGDGPVHAIDTALRQALSSFYPSIKKVSLIDYKVRVLDSGSATASKVRVLITSTDGSFFWTTVGVSTDIIEASYIALKDSFDYYLNR